MVDITQVACFLINAHYFFLFSPQEQPTGEEEDDESYKEFFDEFSKKDAILEPGISKTFEQ